MEEEVKIEKLEEFNQEVLEKLVDIYMRGYEDMPEYGGEGRRYARRYLRWCWNKAKDGFFIAKIGDEIVGFIVCDKDWFSKYEGRVVGAIHEFVIDKRYQGKSIGKKLMEKCLCYLSKYNDKIELWVGEKNKKAIKFYEKYGFRVAGQSGIWVRMVKDIQKEAGKSEKENKKQPIPC
ncbi:GNAT family N-acetyltransferase [Thermococcus sp. LS2]|uniref:GNAT family N-acetyltransferase n=1 Tax=Thermococcus sp. LS2 TaxID=1638260 RepID=UPI001438B8E5|nr:GNAT family N-acetyltransferase [Thermococcus sp. LS2]NJE13191.1 GNAT family N-acetyltransferase [Thermococcus sp. LS2]